MTASPCRDATERPLTGVPCRRPVRRPLRHAGMSLRGLWARSTCRRPVRRPSSPRGDATEMPVGGVGLVGESHEPEPEGRSKCTQRNVGWHFGNYC